jgi:CubicO group peptidase (beta-lactamase class C family)
MTTRREVLASAAALAVAGAAKADSPPAKPSGLPHAKPTEIGIDPRRLDVAFGLLKDWTSGDDAPVPGAALIVGRNGKVVPPRFFGRMGPEKDAEAIRDDAMFLMASITKPVVYIAGMMLVERGLLNLTDKVTRYIPEFKAHGKGETLVGHLFTHTSGLPDTKASGARMARQPALSSRGCAP